MSFNRTCPYCPSRILTLLGEGEYSLSVSEGSFIYENKPFMFPIEASPWLLVRSRTFSS